MIPAIKNKNITIETDLKSSEEIHKSESGFCEPIFTNIIVTQ